MRGAFAVFLIVTSAVAFAAADAPSETDLAAITYFAPVCPFYYRMMGPDGELREFQQLGDGSFKSPRGWSAEVRDSKIIVEAPRRRQYEFVGGRLETYRHGKRSYRITYPFEPVYGGKPASLWGIDPGQMDQEKMQARLDRLTDIWSMTGRLALWFRSPNVAAALLAGVALVGAALFMECASWGTIVGLIVMLASLGGLALTSSRGGMVAFLCGFATILAVAFIRRKTLQHSMWKRAGILVVCLGLAAVFAVSTQGVSRFTKSFARTIEGRGEGRDRSAIFIAGARMMADAPGGWGVRQAGPAYSHWYQAMGGDTWQMTLVSDQLTHLVGYGWFGRWAWICGWLLALGLLWKFALRGFGSAGLAVVSSLLVASLFNVMLSEWALWVLPMFFGAFFAYRFACGEWREWRGYLAWSGLAVVMSVAFLGALFALCHCMEPTVPRIRNTNGVVIIGEGEPSAWIVDDGETLGGIYTQNLLRRHYIRADKAGKARPPAVAYCRTLSQVPARVVRLVLAGRQGANYLELLRHDMAMSARETVFISPPFGPKAVPESLFRRTNIALLLGEFAARYVDVYGEGPYPNWVTLVKGAELFVPNWTDYVIGGN